MTFPQRRAWDYMNKSGRPTKERKNPMGGQFSNSAEGVRSF